jgi:proteasome lid subunit RPN8/RPN11
MTNYIITDCEQFSKKIKDEMFHLIAKTKMTGKEHGAKLCEKDDNNKIILSNSCIGSKCAIIPEKFTKATCPKDTTEIGTFHTHPSWYIDPSQGDILVTLDKGYKLSCIGTDLYVGQNKETFMRTIYCHEIKNRQLKRLGKELRDTKDKDKRNKIIDSMVGILDQFPYIDEILNHKCSMEQSNEPKRRIWNEKKKKYIETFH